MIEVIARVAVRCRVACRLCSVVMLGGLWATATAAQDESLQSNEHYRVFKSWAVDTQQPDPIPNMFKFCLEAYDKMIASGVLPSAKVPEESIPSVKYGAPDIVWTGTVADIRENWCEAGGSQKSAELDKRLAPYRSALKNDKLRLVVDATHGHVSSYALPGGRYTDDPAKLAKETVWFLDLGAPSNEAQNCVNGAPRKIVRRYSFDGEQRLLDTTSQEYCGDPPSSAYR